MNANGAYRCEKGALTIAAESAEVRTLVARLSELRENEPDQYTSTPDEVEAFIRAVGELIPEATRLASSLTEAQTRFLHDASMRQVRIARARLDLDRHHAIETLTRLFRLGTLPNPDGRYEGELIGLSTGLLSDPFFDWMTRIYLPWLGKTFDAAGHHGDNVFIDNAWSRATGKFGWPEYRVQSETPPHTVRVFPFKSGPAIAVEDEGLTVLRLDYAHSPNPLPVRRLNEEVVELPGGYLLGKAHMRGLRELRRVCFFGLHQAQE
jgi:hypothetical protein